MNENCEKKTPSIDLGKVAHWLMKHWKVIAGIIAVAGFFSTMGYTLADFGHKHAEVQRDVDALKRNAMDMQNDIRSMRESMIRTEVILERIEKKL